MLAECFGDLSIQTVELLGLLCFVGEIDHIRDGRLHPKRQFVGLDSRAGSRVVRVFDGSQIVEFVEQPELPLHNRLDHPQ